MELLPRRTPVLIALFAVAYWLLAGTVSALASDIDLLASLRGEVPEGELSVRLLGLTLLLAFTVAYGLLARRFHPLTTHRTHPSGGAPGSLPFDQSSVLRHQGKALEAALDYMGVMIAVVDVRLRLVRANAAYAESAGATPGALIGRGHFELFPDAAGEAAFREALEHGVPCGASGRPFHHPQRGLCYRDWTVAPLKHDDGHIDGLLLSLTDVTERERALQALRAGEERFALAMAGANDGLWDWDMAADTIYRSSRWHQMFEIPPDEGNTQATWRHGIQPNDLARFDRELHRLRKGEVDHLVIVYRYLAHGREKWILDRATVVRDENGAPKRMVGTTMDITERKQVERELETISRFYGVLSEANKVIVRSTDREQLLGQICRIVVQEGALAMVWIGSVDPVTRRLVPVAAAGDDSGFLAQTVVALDNPQQRLCPAAQAIHSGRFVVANDVENDPRTVDWRAAARARGFRSMATFPMVENGEASTALITYAAEAGFFDHERVDLLNGLVDDVAFALGGLKKEQRRMAAEMALQQAHMELEQRVYERTADLEAAYRELESFSYSISHDLRGPLRAINSYCHMLVDDHGAHLDEQAHSYMARAVEATVRLDRMIDGLLTLSRVSRAELQRTAVDLVPLAQQVMEELRRIDPGRRVEVVLPPSLPVDADPALLRIVLDNLLGNAWKFTGAKAEARIEVGGEQGEDGAVYWVRDNGAGFHAAYAGKLFKAFHRAHDPHEFPGNGIGLATVARIIQGHRGRIWAESEEGAGATFYFTLGPSISPPAASM